MIYAGTTPYVTTYYGRKHVDGMYSGNYLIYPLKTVKTTTVTLTADNLLAANNNVDFYPRTSTMRTPDPNLWIRVGRSTNTNAGIRLFPPDIRRYANSSFVFVAIPSYKIINVKLYYSEGYPDGENLDDEHYDAVNKTYEMNYDHVQEAVIAGVDTSIQQRFSKIEVTYSNADFLLEGEYEKSYTNNVLIKYNNNSEFYAMAYYGKYYASAIPSNATSIKLPQSSYITSLQKFKFAPTSMQTSFENCAYLTSVDFSKTDTTYCTSFGWTFKNCNVLNDVDLTYLKTGSATTMQSMFDRCYGLSSVDLSYFDTTYVTNMNTMFIYCRALTSLDLSSFNTSAVTACDYMFQWCQSLTTLNLSNWDLSNLSTSKSMFDHCDALSTLTMNNTNDTTFNTIINKSTTKLPTTVTIYRDGTTYLYNSTQDTWVKNT